MCRSKKKITRNNQGSYMTAYLLECVLLCIVCPHSVKTIVGVQLTHEHAPLGLYMKSFFFISY